jgi:hypothetical protein
VTIGQIRPVLADLDLHRILAAGLWPAYENAPEVNRRLLELFTTASS